LFILDQARTSSSLEVQHRADNRSDIADYMNEFGLRKQLRQRVNVEGVFRCPVDPTAFGVRLLPGDLEPA
jgi:hypothetical protein